MPGADIIVETASLASMAPPEPTYEHSVAVRSPDRTALQDCQILDL